MARADKQLTAIGETGGIDVPTDHCGNPNSAATGVGHLYLSCAAIIASPVLMSRSPSPSRPMLCAVTRAPSSSRDNSSASISGLSQFGSGAQLSAAQFFNASG